MALNEAASSDGSNTLKNRWDVAFHVDHLNKLMASGDNQSCRSYYQLVLQHYPTSVVEFHFDIHFVFSHSYGTD